MNGSSIRRTLVARALRRNLDRQLIDAGRQLSLSGLVHGRSGNLSARDGDRFRITVAGARLARLRHDDFASVPTSGETTAGRRPSSEVALHAAIYRARRDVSAIVHTHSPYATAWASMATCLELVMDEASYYDMGSLVRVAPHAPAGSLRLAHLAATRLGDGAALLLERHGAVAVGADVQAALDVAESLEHQAHVAWILDCRNAGRNPALPASARPIEPSADVTARSGTA